MTKSKNLLAGFVMWLLSPLGLLILWLLFLRGKSFSNNPKTIITNRLTQAGYDALTSHFWVAVSQFETGNFTSKLFTDYNNLFGMGYPSWPAPGKPNGINSGYVDSSDGRKSTFVSQDQAMDNIIWYLQKENWPKQFPGFVEAINLMKSNGYFTANLNSYLTGVSSYFY